MRRTPWRALVLTFSLLALVAIFALVPLLSRVAQGTQRAPGTPAANVATPRATPTAASQRTPTPNDGAQGAQSPQAALAAVQAAAAALHSAAETQYVDGIIANMSLDEELGQMIQVSFYGQTTVEPWVLDEISRDHIGSVILYDSNLQSAASARQWTSALQSQAKIPLLLGADVEGGTVNRLYAINGPLPSAAEIGARGDPNYARQAGAQTAADLHSLGMNTDYAPVVDVDSGIGAAGGELGGRMFGSTPDKVTQMAGAFLSGLQQGNEVVGSLKHFPGLGDAQADPHHSLFVINRSLADLERIDWAPYSALISTGQVGLIMSTHVIISAVDPTRPASLSRPVITGILRNQLHYNGVIITDGIYMLQQQGSYTYDQSVLYAVQAGNDIVSAAYDPGAADEALRVLHQAVTSGAVSKQQIDDSVRRILLLKLHLGLLSPPKA